MYTTLDWLIVCVLGGLGVGLYIGCVLHFRELCEVKEIADNIANNYEKLTDEYLEREELLMDCADALMAWHDEKEREEYNGWINRETWAFMLWQSGDAFLYDLIRDMSAQIAVAQGIFENEDALAGYISNRGMTDIEKRNLGAEYVKEWSDYAEEMLESDYSDLFKLALSDIGSMWRVDPESIGDALEEHVRERLFDGENIAIVNEEDYCDLLQDGGS